MVQGRLTKLLFVVLLFSFAVAPVVAQEEFEFDSPEECHDLPILSRMPDCKISGCQKAEFDTVKVLAGPWSDAAGDVAWNTLEGSWEKVEYGCLGKVTVVQIARNAETALKAAGYERVVYVEEGPFGPGFTYRNGTTWVEVLVGSSPRGYHLKVVRTKAMAQDMTATAEALATAIESSGRVAVYGIQFDTNKATIKPESIPVLSEVKKLLEQQPEIKLTIEGHTDSTGSVEANLKLSTERAAAVVEWLVQEKIARDRLSAKGLGSSQPVADNAKEEGRAKNRRVELVKH